jgi:serine/threonine protein phosphatase PrpC
MNARKAARGIEFPKLNMWRVKRTFGVINEKFNSELILCCDGISDILCRERAKLLEK